MDQLSAQYVLMASGHHSQLCSPGTTVAFVEQLQAVIERSSAPRKNFLIDTTTPHGDAVITEASAMKPGIGWITLQVTEGIRRGVHEWCVKIENQGETTDGSGLMLGILPKAFTKYDSFISQGGGWCLSRAGKFYGHWRRHEASTSSMVSFGTGDRVIFTLDYDNARMTVRVGDKQLIGEISNLTTEVYPAISLHYRHQHVRFEYHVTHDRTAKQLNWIERGVLPSAAVLLPLPLAMLERTPLDSYLFSAAFTKRQSRTREKDRTTADPEEDEEETSGGSEEGDSGTDEARAHGVATGAQDVSGANGEAATSLERAPSGVRGRRRKGHRRANDTLPYVSLEAFSARLTVLLNALSAVRRYTEVSPAHKGKFLSPSVTAEYLRKRFYESLRGSFSRGRGGASHSAAVPYDATLDCGAVIVIHMFAQVAGVESNPMALPLVKSLSDYLLSLPLFSLSETTLSSSLSGTGAGAGAFMGGGVGSTLSPDIVKLAMNNIFMLVESAVGHGRSCNGQAAAPNGDGGGGSGDTGSLSALARTLVELAALLALQRGVVHEVLRACRLLLRCPRGVVSRSLTHWLMRNSVALRPRKELPNIRKALRIACEDVSVFRPMALRPEAMRTTVLSVAYGGDSEGACAVFVHFIDGLSRYQAQVGRYEETRHTKDPVNCLHGATRSSMAVTLTHVFLLADSMASAGVAVVLYTTALELHRVFSFGEMDATWPRDVRACAQVLSGPDDQILLVYERHEEPAVHIANGAAAASAKSTAVLNAGGSIARAATRGGPSGVQLQGFLFPSFPRPVWSTTLKAPSPNLDFSLSHCLALRKPCSVDLGPPDNYLVLPGGHVTVEMWVTLLDKEETATLYQHGDKSTTGEVFMETTRLEGAYCIRGGYRHDARGSCVVSASLPPTAETQFFHIALVFDGRWHLYFDGEEVACNRQGPHVSLDAPKQRWTLGNNCTCLLAGLRVWLLGRSSREVARDYKRFLAGDEPGLVSQMFFNEYSGNVVFNYVASTHSRHAVCSGTFDHAPCKQHPWKSFGGNVSVSSLTADDGVAGPSESGGAESAVELRAPPRSAIHNWTDLTLTRCFCCQQQLVLSTQVGDAAPYALNSGRVFVFFDCRNGTSYSAFFYLSSKSSAHGYMGLDSTWNRMYELFDLDASASEHDGVAGSISSGDPGAGGSASAGTKTVCLVQLPFDRDDAVSSAFGTSASSACFLDSGLSADFSHSSLSAVAEDAVRSDTAHATGPAAEDATSCAPALFTHTATTPSSLMPAKLTYSALSLWLLQLLGQYAAEEPAQEIAQLFSPLADDVGCACTAEVQSTLTEHFRVVKGHSARRVVALASPISKDVIACALQVLLRLIRRVRAFGLHPSSVGLNTSGGSADGVRGAGGTAEVNRLLRELSVYSPRRRNTPRCTSSLPAVGLTSSTGSAVEEDNSGAESACAGSLVGLLADVINEAGKTLPPSLGVLATTVVSESIDLFIPSVRSRAKLLREVLTVTSCSPPLMDRTPALEAVVDGTVRSLSTVLAAAPLLCLQEDDARGSTESRPGPAGDGETAVEVLRLTEVDDGTEDECEEAASSGDVDVAAVMQRTGSHGEKNKDPLRETRRTLQALIAESLTELRAHFSAGLRSDKAVSIAGGKESHALPLPIAGTSSLPPSAAAPADEVQARRRRNHSSTQLIDAISALQILLLSACQGIPAEDLVNSFATNQKLSNLFAVPRPAPEHRHCVRAHYKGLFEAAREALEMLHAAASASSSSSPVPSRACPPQPAAADAAPQTSITGEQHAAIAASFLAAPLHTAILCIPLVVSVGDAPWFLDQLEVLLPLCAAGRARNAARATAPDGASPASVLTHAASTSLLSSSSALRVLFDAVLLSASWVATRMSRAKSATEFIADAESDCAASTTPLDPPRGERAAEEQLSAEPVSKEETSAASVATARDAFAEHPLLREGVDLCALDDVQRTVSSALPSASSSPADRQPHDAARHLRGSAKRRALLLADLRSNALKYRLTLQQLDAIGKRVPDAVADVVVLIAVTSTYLCGETETQLAKGTVLQAVRRLAPVRGELLQRRAQSGGADSTAFATLLEDIKHRCCALLCAANVVANDDLDEDQLLTASSTAHPVRLDAAAGKSPAAAPQSRWGTARSRIHQLLSTRRANVLPNTQLSLTEAIRFVSSIALSATLTFHSLVNGLQARERLAVVRLQGLEQLITLMRQEPCCTESVAQLLSTHEGEGVSGVGSAGTESGPGGAGRAAQSCSGNVERAFHFEHGVGGCAPATRARLRQSMYKVLEWLVAYERGGSVSLPRDARTTDGAAERLPFLCAFLRRTWWPRDLDQLRRIGLPASLFDYCSLKVCAVTTGFQPASPHTLRMPSEEEQLHRREIMAYQRQLAAVSPTPSVGGGASAGSLGTDTGTASNALLVRGTASSGSSTNRSAVIELTLVPSLHENAKRHALECLRELGLQAAAVLRRGEASWADRQAAEAFLADVVLLAARELEVCFTARKELSHLADRGEEGALNQISPSELTAAAAVQDQVQAITSLVGTIFQAIPAPLIFFDALQSATLSTVVCLLQWAGESVADAGDGAAGSALGKDGILSHSARAREADANVLHTAVLLRLVTSMLPHCSPANADEALRTRSALHVWRKGEDAVRTSPSTSRGHGVADGTTVTILHAIAVESLRLHGLDAVARAAMVGLRGLLCSRPSWADTLGLFADSFKRDLQNAGAQPSNPAASHPLSVAAKRVRQAYKLYVWSAVLGGCTLFVPSPGMRVRHFTEDAENGGSTDAEEAYLLTAPSQLPEGSGAGADTRANDAVTLLPTTTVLTGDMSWDEYSTAPEVGREARTQAMKDFRSGQSSLRKMEEVQSSYDRVFLPPLSDTVEQTLPPYPLLTEEFVCPAVKRFLDDLAESDVRRLHNIEVSAVVGFIHLVVRLVRASPSSCRVMLENHTLQRVSRFASRSAVHSPLPLFFLKEYAAYALRGVCENAVMLSAQPLLSEAMLGNSATSPATIASFLAHGKIPGRANEPQPASGPALPPGPFLWWDFMQPPSELASPAVAPSSVPTLPLVARRSQLSGSPGVDSPTASNTNAMPHSGVLASRANGAAYENGARVSSALSTVPFATPGYGSAPPPSGTFARLSTSTPATTGGVAARTDLGVALNNVSPTPQLSHTDASGTLASAVGVPPLTTALCFHAAPAGGRDVQQNTAGTVTIARPPENGNTGQTGKRQSGFAFPAWTDGLSVEMAIMLVDRLFPQLGDDYVIPPSATCDSNSYRPAISFSLLSLYIRSESSERTRLVHVFIERDALQCVLTLPPRSRTTTESWTSANTYRCSLPLRKDDWDAALHVAVILDAHGLLVTRAGESASVALPEDVISSLGSLLGHETNAFDSLVIGCEQAAPTMGSSTDADAAQSNTAASLGVNADDGANVFVTGLRVWGSSVLKAWLKTMSDLVANDMMLPSLEIPEDSLFFELMEGAGPTAQSADGAVTAALHGYVRWVNCQLYFTPSLMDPPDKVNVGPTRLSPGGGNQLPPAVLPRAEVAAFFDSLDPITLERVSSEYLWSMVAWLTRMAVASAAEQCLGPAYLLSAGGGVSTAGSPEEKTNRREASEFPFDPFLLFGNGPPSLMSDLTNLFRYSDAAYLTVRNAQLIKKFVQYTMRFVVAAAAGRAKLTDTSSTTANPVNAAPSLSRFMEETANGVMELLLKENEMFTQEIASTNRNSIGMTTSLGRTGVSPAPVVPLILLNGGKGVLNFTGKSRPYESISVYKDRALKNLLDKVPDSQGTFHPCQLESAAAQWVFLSIAGLKSGATPPTTQLMMAAPPAVSVHVATKSLRPVALHAVIAAIAEVCASGQEVLRVPGSAGTEDFSAAVGDAVAPFLSGRLISQLLQVAHSRVGLHVRMPALNIANAIMQIWRAFPSQRRFDQAPLNIVLAYTSMAVLEVFRRDKQNGGGSATDLSPALGAYSCGTQMQVELLTSAIRLEEAWLQCPHTTRVQARRQRLCDWWTSCTQYLPVAAPLFLSSTPSRPPRKPTESASVSPRQADSTTSKAAGGGSRAASVPVPSATAVTPVSVGGHPGAAAHSSSSSSRPVPSASLFPPLSPAALAKTTPTRVPDEPRGFGSLSTSMNGAIPPFEVQVDWPLSLQAIAASPLSASHADRSHALVNSPNYGTVALQGDGCWLATCARGCVTVRSTIGFSKGCFYFEVSIPERPMRASLLGSLIVGVSTARCRLGETGEPVGSDAQSWGFDIARLCRIHQGYRTDFSSRAKWKAGDVLGIMMDISNSRVVLLRGEEQESAFDRLRTATGPSASGDRATAGRSGDGPDDSEVYFPTVTLTAGCACEINFGTAPFSANLLMWCLPATPQHYSGPQALKLWTLMVALEWSRMCGAAADSTGAAGVLSHPALQIVQRRIREECDGRCGPLTSVDFLTSTARLREGFDELQTEELPCIVRGAVAVRRGKWYYEVRIRTIATSTATPEGSVTVGWAVADVDGDWSAGAVPTAGGGVAPLPGKSLGDDEFSWVLEGKAMLAKHNRRQTSLSPHEWTDGDVVGCLLDCDAGTMRFTVNGKLQREIHDTDGDGVLFRNVCAHGGAGLSPVIAVDAKMSVVFMWNQEDLLYPPFDAGTLDAAPSCRSAALVEGAGGAGKYKAVGALNVFRDAIEEHYLGLGDTHHSGAVLSGAAGAGEVSLHGLERTVRFISKTVDLSAHRLPAYCLFSLYGLRSHPPATPSRRLSLAGGRATATSTKSRGKITPSRQAQHGRSRSHSAADVPHMDADALRQSSRGNAPHGADRPDVDSPMAATSAAALGLSSASLRACGEQLLALSAAAETLYRFAQDVRIPKDVEEVHDSILSTPLHAALRRLHRYTLPYLGLRIMRRFLCATDSAGDSLKLIVDRRAALAAAQDGAALSAGQRLTASLFYQVYSLLRRKSATVFCTSKKMWSVSFLGEGADDVGGPYRECLSQMCAELMSPSGMLPLFIQSPNQVADVGESRDAFVPRPHLESNEVGDMYAFLGRLLGGCLRGGEPLSLYLPSTVWKLLVGAQPDRSDLALTDHATSHALDHIDSIVKSSRTRTAEEESSLNEELQSMWCPDGFTAQDDAGDLHELVKGGHRIPVQAGNAALYVALCATLKVSGATREQLMALRSGFHDVVPLCCVAALKWFELEELVCGRRDYDPDALLDSARYEPPLDPDDTRILFLRQALREFSPHQRALFMRFVSGRERMPQGMRLRIMADRAPDSGTGGAGAEPSPYAPQPPPSTLEGGGSGRRQSSSVIRQQSSQRQTTGGEPAGPSSGSQRLPAPPALSMLVDTTPLSAEDARLPHASTCFYWLSLPAYSSYPVLRERLLYAVEQCVDIDADFRVHDSDVDQQDSGPQITRVTVDEDDDAFEDFSHLR